MAALANLANLPNPGLHLPVPGLSFDFRMSV